MKHGPRSLALLRVEGCEKPRGAVKAKHMRSVRSGRHCDVVKMFYLEQLCWDPKDGELCRARAKPEETLVEARSDADVQIARRTWV